MKKFFNCLAAGILSFSLFGTLANTQSVHAEEKMLKYLL